MSEYSQHASVTVTGKSWDERRVAEAGPAHALASATFSTTYAGDIEGESTCALLISYAGAGDAHVGGGGNSDELQSLVGPYTGYEQVTGTLAGRSGTFVLATAGEHSGGVARTDVTVVPESATGELVGLRGSGHYVADAMEYTLELDYDFS
jgi:hypothetical protein